MPSARYRHSGWHAECAPFCSKASTHGLSVFTNYESAKGREPGRQSRAAACFLWNERHRQAIVRGTVSKLPHEEAQAYFATRPQGAPDRCLGSAQSQIIPDRQWLESALRSSQPNSAKRCPARLFGADSTLLPSEIEFCRPHERTGWIAFSTSVKMEPGEEARESMSPRKK
ncbi:MAG: pyridoxamine 5'-phosphate oxidase family protein [Verrucomicrobiaceae bacterium]|nr:pyridoxamine 5'-phosphate oxidase family protein [Verrucomicrobiaceae bacterium]